MRKKYACTRCETNGENPNIHAAKKPEIAIDKGLAGPGLLAYIVTSKFSDYLPLYRLEDIFTRQGFEISRATQSVWCGDVADLVEPLYALMADRVRCSHVVATDDTIMPMQSKDKVANALGCGSTLATRIIRTTSSTSQWIDVAMGRRGSSKITTRFC